MTVFFNIIIILLFKINFNLDDSLTNALAVMVTGATGFIHLHHVSRPFNALRIILFTVLLIVFTYGALFMNEFFVLKEFNTQIGLILFLLIIFSIFSYNFLESIVNKIFEMPN